MYNSSMQLNGRYYKDGYVHIDFDTTSLRRVIDEAENDPTAQQCTWESKYPNAYDLRPAASYFSHTFIDVLLENNIPQLLEAATCSSELTLSHCQVRRAWPVDEENRQSYMPWHRDTYLDKDGNWVGNQPPVHKLIVYPEQSGRCDPRLRVTPGSHRCMFDHPDMDRSAYAQLGLFGRNVTIRASNQKALLFNTSLLHSVVPESTDEGSIRVIYSFMTRKQFESGYKNIDHHRYTNKLYEDRKNKGNQ